MPFSTTNGEFTYAMDLDRPAFQELSAGFLLDSWRPSSTPYRRDREDYIVYRPRLSYEDLVDYAVCEAGEMTVCVFYQQGRCRYGSACKNEHPGQTTNYNSANRFGPLSGQGDRYRPSGSNGTRPRDYHVTPDTIKTDLKNERPEWPLSAYGPGRNAPRQLIEGPIELSPEEVRVRYYIAKASGNEAAAQQQEKDLAMQMQAQIESILKDMNGAVRYIEEGERVQGNRNDIAAQYKTEGKFERDRVQADPTSGPSAATANPFSTTSALGGSSQASGFNKTGTPAFGQTAFGQTSTQPSGFGQPSSFGGQGSAFGKPSLPGQTAFGQPSAPGQAAGFGQTSALGQGAAFGKPGFGQPGFGQPSSLGQTSSLGQGSTFAQPSSVGQTSALSQPSTLGQSTSQTSAFGKPAFGQPAFGQTSQPAASAPFGQAQQPAQAAPFGQAVTQNPLGGTTPAQPAFGQAAGVAQPRPAFGAPTGTSTFGQPAQTQASTPFGTQAQQKPTPSPFGQANPTSLSSALAGNAMNIGASSASTSSAPNSTRDPATGLLTTWKGRPVVYKNKEEAYYALTPDADPNNLSAKHWGRIFFPNGPGPNQFDPEKNEFKEGRPEEYEGARGKELQAIFAEVNRTGSFPGGQIPLTPPKMEWVGWDI